MEKSIGAFVLLPLQGVTFVIYLDTFLDLVKRASEPKMKEPDREMTYLIRNLAIWLKRVEKKPK